MDKRKKYKPVNEYSKQTTKKPLTQGTLTDCEDKLASKTTNKENFNQISILSQKDSKQLYLDTASDNDCLITETIVVNNPKSLILSPRSESDNGESIILNSNQLQLKNMHAYMSTNESNKNCTDISHAKSVHVNDLHSSGVKTLTKPCNEINGNEKLSKMVTDVQKKKKRTKSVASRYMTQTKKLPHAKTEKSLMSSTSKVNVKHTKINLDETKEALKKKPASDGKTSTPTSKFKVLFESDVSTIHIPAIKSGIASVNSVSQSLLNVHYAQYLRICYLKSALQKSFNTKESSSVADLHKLTDIIADLEQEVADLECQVSRSKHEENLFNQIDEQLEILEPVEYKIDEVCANYKIIAENIDTVRHSLPVVDTIISTKNSLLSLKQTDFVLNDIAMVIHGHSTNCATSAHHADCLKSVAANEIQYLKSTNRDLELTKALLAEDTNLRLQLETENLILNNK